MNDITVIILTRNEALHIERAIASVAAFATRVLVIDSGATDNTVALAKAAGAEVRHNPWTNYATQFNWALDQIAGQDTWVFRLDADEVVTPELAAQIKAGLPDVAGISIGRQMCFMGQPIRHGGLFPIRVLRLFRNGRGRVEDRWMDEHTIVDGPVAGFSGCIIDDNRNNLDWWIAKHNSYASREVIDVLNQEYGFLPQESIGGLRPRDQAAVKRWIKEHAYARLPGGLRAGLYFIYRYVFQLGFLDGRKARAFHVLQGFWYRYLVDTKLMEVRDYITQHDATPVAAIEAVLGVTLTPLPERVAA
ncbi:glycosyltransferase family 2 protein [Cognatiyoonia sp. IB215446]|uniref:glycosyltransferase family 2 protein n=1 Tax=Cognatiyoonia sp. IB215446 TaxID=3097355 RepID=UPI002A0D8B1D|nr:glycosyltransferase family 2 protein [Cognatiyoonia sp. IB215446]MDX8347929.1 glycosyltransferase family 2 protein [Cognatiyoonia sp. IB215446]